MLSVLSMLLKGREVWCKELGRLFIGGDDDVERLMRGIHERRSAECFMSIEFYLKEDNKQFRLANPLIVIEGDSDSIRYLLLVSSVLSDFLSKHGIEHYFVVGPNTVELVTTPCLMFSDKGRGYLYYAKGLAEIVLRGMRTKLLKASYTAAGRVSIRNSTDISRGIHIPYVTRERDSSWILVPAHDIERFDEEWFKEPYIPRTRIIRLRNECSVLDKEALKLAEKSLNKLTEIKASARSIPKLGRFPVMALLQAARYYLLAGDLDKAKSFGLNRAIFYAWAKNKGYVLAALRRFHRGEKAQLHKIVKSGVVDDEVPLSPRGWPAMGDLEQRPEDYDHVVARKIEEVMPYEIAWKAALKYVSTFNREVLRDPQKFFKYVYEPVRDDFIQKVVLRGGIVEKHAFKHALSDVSKRGEHTKTRGKSEEKDFPRRKFATLDRFLGRE